VKTLYNKHLIVHSCSVSVQYGPKKEFSDFEQIILPLRY